MFLKHCSKIDHQFGMINEIQILSVISRPEITTHLQLWTSEYELREDTGRTLLIISRQTEHHENTN